MAKAKRRRGSEGYAYWFHGSFKSAAAAEAKARKVRGRDKDAAWVIKRLFRAGGGPIQIRYIVQSERAPF